MIRAKFFVVVEVKGHRDALDLECTAEIPFVPRVGDWIAPLPNDDFREVESVYWSADHGFAVHFEEDGRVIEKQLLKSYLDLGWKETP